MKGKHTKRGAAGPRLGWGRPPAGPPLAVTHARASGARPALGPCKQRCAFLQPFLEPKMGINVIPVGADSVYVLVSKFFVMYFFRDLEMAFALKYFHLAVYISLIRSFVNVPYLIFKVCFKAFIFKLKTFWPLYI